MFKKTFVICFSLETSFDSNYIFPLENFISGSSAEQKQNPSQRK